MAFHSLGGLRSLATVRAPDRIIMRLSPIQTWIMEQAVKDTVQWVPLAPVRALMSAAQRLVSRGLIEMSRDKTCARYKPLASAEVVSANYAGSLPRNGKTNCGPTDGSAGGRQ